MGHLKRKNESENSLSLCEGKGCGSKRTAARGERKKNIVTQGGRGTGYQLVRRKD